MSELKSLEKLRPFGINTLTTTELHAIADAIQAEVDERYILLPVDADGEPIHVGDRVESNMSVGGTVSHISSESVVFKGYGVDSGCLRHVNPRTVEDVLTDALVEYDETDRLTPGEIVAKYASELRMAE